MSDFVNSSALTKLLANIFVFLVLVAALGIAVYDVVVNQAIPSYITWLLSSALTYAVTLLGFHVGASQGLQAQQSQLQAQKETLTSTEEHLASVETSGKLPPAVTRA